MHGLKKWFYPHAKRLSKRYNADKTEKDWLGRVPVLVEDAWKHQQAKIDRLEKDVELLNKIVSDAQNEKGT